MKFQAVWADIASQNNTLKIVCVALAGCIVSLSILTTAQGIRDPLVIEQGVTASAIAAVKKTDPEEEVENFLYDVIPMRFDSQPRRGKELNLNLISVSLARTKESEQAEYGQKRMTQTVVIRSLDIKNDVTTVQADRIVAVDKLRSAFAVTLEAKIARVTRSSVNPYGLVLTNVTVQQKESAQ